MSRRVRPRWPLGAGATALVLALLAVIALLRVMAPGGAEGAQSEVFTEKLVVVGSTDHHEVTEADSAVISNNSDRVQAGAISVRPRYLAECGAAGWTTLGAGRRAGVEKLCAPEVTGSGGDARVADWEQRKQAAAVRGGDARLGTLGRLSDGCIQAVGPGAALAAAHPDGSLDRYRDPDAFADGGYSLDCPLTLVDSGGDSVEMLKELNGREDVTVIVTGIGHDPTMSLPPEHNPRGLQLIYRVGTTLPGLMTSDSTRRDGVVTLTDLSRTLIGFVHSGPVPAGAPLVGSPILVEEQPVSAAGVTAHLQQVENLSEVAPTGYVAGTLICLLAAGAIVILARRGRHSAVRPLLALLATMPATLMLTGAFPWAAEDRPTAALLFALGFWAAALTGLALGGARLFKVPIPVAAAGLTVAAFTLDALLGAPMQPGSLLNSKPIQATRWYGFGNVTFACYATAGLAVAGYLGHRFVRSGHRVSGVVAVLLVGGLVIGCQGWPSMGADFGGVIGLTPGVLWLALAVSGLRTTWPKMIMIGVGAVLAVSAVAVLDWTRGAGNRSHLGNFVQRVLDGDAAGILIRKALAAADSMISVYGVIGLVFGVTAWVLILRRLRHPITGSEFPGYASTAIAALIVAVVGTLLNDNAVAVWLTVTGVFVVYTAGLLHQRLSRDGWPAVLHDTRASASS